MPDLQRTGKEISKIYNRQVETVYRICYSFMKNTSDTEDMVQETFLRLIRSGMLFESEEHEKAWLIVTASNLCKDALKHWWRKTEDITAHTLRASEPPPETNHILEAVLNLPLNLKTAVYMYYYEGYSAQEIAAYLRCPPSTVRSRLARARKKLKNELGGDF